MLKPYFAETNGYNFMAFVGDDGKCIVMDDGVMAKNVRDFKGDIRDAVEILDQMTADGVLPVDYDDDLGCWDTDDYGNTIVYDFAELCDEAFTDHIELTPDVVATVHTLEKLEKKEYKEDNVGFPIDIGTVRDAMKHPERNIIEPPQDVPRRRGASL